MNKFLDEKKNSLYNEGEEKQQKKLKYHKKEKNKT